MRASEEEKEVLVDSAPIIGVSPVVAEKKDKLSSTDIEALEDALDTLGQEKKTLLVEKEELDDLKEELEQYKEVMYIYDSKSKSANNY